LCLIFEAEVQTEILNLNGSFEFGKQRIKEEEKRERPPPLPAVWAEFPGVRPSLPGCGDGRRPAVPTGQPASILR
jgi:hypothetical protein